MTHKYTAVGTALALVAISLPLAFELSQAPSARRLRSLAVPMGAGSGVSHLCLRLSELLTLPSLSGCYAGGRRAYERHRRVVGPAGAGAVPIIENNLWAILRRLAFWLAVGVGPAPTATN
jgi:hypothetical protein